MIIAMITILFLALITCASSNAYDVRQVNWGMSISEVKKIETAKLFDETENYLMYEIMLLDKKFVIRYDFIEKKLHAAGCLLMLNHINVNDYIDDYNALKAMLSKEHGKPFVDILVWKDDSLFKNNPGMAVVTGNLTYLANWRNDRTEIAVILHGENFEATCGIMYESIVLAATTLKETRL
jgi:hypothetical protein